VVNNQRIPIAEAFKTHLGSGAWDGSFDDGGQNRFQSILASQSTIDVNWHFHQMPQFFKILREVEHQVRPEMTDPTTL